MELTECKIVYSKNGIENKVHDILAKKLLYHTGLDLKSTKNLFDPPRPGKTNEHVRTYNTTIGYIPWEGVYKIRGFTNYENYRNYRHPAEMYINESFGVFQPETFQIDRFYSI
jgi:hypothetical protein